MKRFIVIAFAVVVVAASILTIWLLTHRAPRPVPGSITLPDGSWVSIEAVTYGTNHRVGPPLAHVADRMPQSMRNLMLRHIGRPAVMRFSYTTPSPTLVVWLNRGVSAMPFGTNMGWLECVLSDTNGVTCGDFVPYAARYPLETKEFAVFPRRGSAITLTIYYHDAAGAVFTQGSTTFANPEYHRYPTWKPEPLPATKLTGDVEATLEFISTGIDRKIEFENSPTGHRLVFTSNTIAGASATVCHLRLRATTNTNEIWRACGVEISDATGNRITPQKFDTDNESGDIVFSPALWPGESAWNVRFELTRVAGFNPEALFTFHDVPLAGPNVTNRLGWTTNRNGVEVTLEQTARHEPVSNTDPGSSAACEVRFGVGGLTNTWHLDLISATTETGEELVRHWVSDQGTNVLYRFAPPKAESKIANFTFVVQQSRWVEFRVKPATGPAPRKLTPNP